MLYRSKKNSYSSIITAVLVSISCLILVIETAYADLQTTPPVIKLTKHTKKTQIENTISKAQEAIKQNQLSKPEKNNAVFYAQQLLALSPGDDRARSILTEVMDAYTALAYTELDSNKIDIAQMYHNKGEEIGRRFNIKYDYRTLANLQREIVMRQQEIDQLRSALKKQIGVNESSAKTEQKAQEKPLTDVEEQSSPPEVQISQKTIQIPLQKKKDTATTTSAKPPLSPAESNRIVVIVNKQNKVPALTLRELKSLYKGHQKTWPNGEIVTLFLPPTHSDEQLWLVRNIFQNRSPEAAAQFYMGGIIRNDFTKTPATSTNSVSDVSRIVGSIAIVKVGKIKDGDAVKILPIKGI